MKKYDDMIRDVHRRMEEYEAERKLKRTRLVKTALAVTPVCAAAVVGTVLWKCGAVSPETVKPVRAETVLTELAVSGEKVTRPSVTSAEVRTSAETKTSEVTAKTETAASAEKTTAETSEVSTSAEKVTEAKTEPPTEAKTEMHTEAPTEPPTERVTAAETEPAIQEISPSAHGNHDICDKLGSVNINGIWYVQIFDTTQYTPDVYLGNGGDYQGYYIGDTSISFYTAKERSDIVIVVFYDGSELNLMQTDVEV